MQVILEQEKKEVKHKKVEITKDCPSVLICTYGTLRSTPASGNGNYRALLEGNGEYLGTYQSEPTYTMYGRHAGFPVVTDNGTTAITYEVFRVTDAAVLANLNGLEGCTGIPGDKRNWYDICPITTPHGQGWIYVMHHSGRATESIIPTGNWDDRNI